MSYKLYLDDQRLPLQSYKKYKIAVYDDINWCIVRNYDQFVHIIQQNGLPDLISFDHDLGIEHIEYFFKNGGHEIPPNPDYSKFKEKTGYDCAKFVIDYCLDNDLKFPEYLIHSANPVGSDNIRGLIEGFKKFRAKASE